MLYSVLFFAFTDIDECKTGPFNCDVNANCSDTLGSYQCTCNDGYTGDGETCSDIDECLSNPCDKNATCNNTDGGFFCECDSGFVGDGMSCTRE